MSHVPSATSIFSTLLQDRSRPESPALSLEEEVTAFFDELHDPLIRYLMSFRLGVHDAEDVIQDVFLVLFKHLQANKPRANLRGWVFRVAHNLGLKRQRKIRDSRLQNYEETLFPPASGLNPEEELLHVQRTKRLMAIVHALPDRNRHCLFLRAEGLRYREIAHVLGISLGSVANALEQSLKRLSDAESR